MVHQESDSAYDKFVMGLRDYEQASALVQMQMDKFLSEFVFIAESALNMRKDGFFSDGTWAGIEGGTLALLRTPGGQQWRKHAQHFVGSEISQHLNARLPQVGPATPNFLNFTPSYLKRLGELDELAVKRGPEAASS